MILRKNIFLCCLLLLAFAAQSQVRTASNLKKKFIPSEGTVRLDSLSIVPQSVTVKGYDTSFYYVDFVESILYWKKNGKGDTVEVSFRIFPFRLNAEVQRYSYDSIRSNFLSKPFIFNRNDKKATGDGLFDFGKVTYNGSFGRSLSFGNNQDAVFNSQLNLQINGYIGDSIEIAAAITDNNIPIQPDGNTQQLNEFDRILLQFRKKGWEVNLGDIDIRQNESYFLSFYKRLQGISYQQTFASGKGRTNKLLVSGAIAKGKFTRNIFQGQEGNQGPYRLQGANSEFFFILLAGTERVFIDGELMQRGEDQDYTISYNTAEVTFTPKRMITKDRRIQVEFEYADRNFLNSMIYVNDEFRVNKKLRFFISVYSNADAKHSPINQTLDANQKQFLNNIGDSVQLALYPVAALDSFSVTKILYRKVDTVYNGSHDSIYIYSTNPDSAKYNLNFIEVGFGRGNYIAFFNGANGKVYKWVQPVNGVKQGNFEPAAFLVTPKSQQLISSGIVYNIDSRTTLQVESAVSNYDVNTYSVKDKNDNKGFATRFSVERKSKWGTAKKQMQLSTALGYEFVSERFRPVERLRPVEFGRDWGLNYLNTPANEHLPFLDIKLSDDKNNTIQYSVSGYLRSDDYKGIRHSLQQFNDVKGWQLRSAVNFTNNNSPIEKGYFFRPAIELSKAFPQLRNHIIGGSYAMEHNEQKNKQTDSLNAYSFAFETLSVYIKSNPTKDNRWSFTYFNRKDKYPFQSALIAVDKSHNYNFSVELLQNAKHQFRSTVTYRQLHISNGLLSKLQPDNNLLGRAEYVMNEFNGFLTASILYELGAGQEQRRDFSYIEVPAGRGEYAWNDYDADGIPQLNEFEIAQFPDQAKYIRIFTPTNEFIKANYTQFNYTVTLNPRLLPGNIRSKKFRNFITRLNFQSSLQTGKKVLADGHPEFNPFKGGITDTSLITLNYFFSNTVSFNRFNSTWGFDVTNNINYNKALLTYGFESRQLNDWIIKGRVNFARQYTFEVIQKIGKNNLFTPKFANRNYQLKTYTTEPRLTFTQATKYRIQASYQFIQKKNAPVYGGENTINNAFNIEAKYNAVQNTSVTGKFTYNNISYKGYTHSTTSYIMLDGLLPGRNFLWTINFTKRLANDLELSFDYEGRKPGETRVINIGRASIRALL